MGEKKIPYLPVLELVLKSMGGTFCKKMFLEMEEKMNRKIYKGYELIEAIANKKIKDYTRIIPHYPNNDCSVEYFEYSNGFIHDDKHSNDVNVCIFLKNDRTFEILEDNTEEIEELKYDVVDEDGRGWYKLDTIADKVTELIKAINKMKRGKE